jgi:hypothetical protein
LTWRAGQAILQILRRSSTGKLGNRWNLSGPGESEMVTGSWATERTSPLSFMTLLLRISHILHSWWIPRWRNGRGLMLVLKTKGSTSAVQEWKFWSIQMGWRLW